MRYLLLLAAGATVLLAQSPAQAERYYPWCAWYDWTTYNCGFTSYQQCLAATSGVGGYCRPNPQAPPDQSGPRSKRAPRAALPVEPSQVPRAGEPARMIQLPNGRWISSYGCVTDDGYGRYRDCNAPIDH